MQSTFLAFFSTAVTTLSVSIVYFIFRYLRTHGRAVATALRLPSILPPLPLTLYHLVVHGITDFVNVTLHQVKQKLSDGIQGCVLWMGPYPIFLVHNPDDIQVVVNNTLEVGAEADVFKEFIGNGLMTCPVGVWRITRRFLQSLYRPRNIELLIPALNQVGRDLALGLSRHLGSGLVDIGSDMAKASLQSACNLIFGPLINVNIKASTTENILDSLKRLGDLVAIRGTQVWLWSDFLFRVIYKKNLNQIHSSFKDFMEEITKLNGDQERSFEIFPRFDQNSITTTNVVPRRDGEYMTLVDSFRLLQEKHSNFTDTDLRNEVASTLAAGSETSQMVMASCVLALASHPDIQERLYVEIVSVVGSGERDVTMEDLKCMPYLEQVLKETLRMFPIVPMITRRTHRDLTLSYGTVPAGATLGLMLSGVHWDPNHYVNPNIYDPDRFLPENIAKRNKYAYVPFSAGPRNCIGKEFAMMSMMIILVHLIMKYRFTTSIDLDKILYLPALVFRAHNGYKVEIVSRNNYIV